MTHDGFTPRPSTWARIKRLAGAWGMFSVFGLIGFLVLWHTFFVKVPPGAHLVIIAKTGKPLPDNHVLAEEGQKGLRKQVLGEGWHFVMPILYDWESEKNTVVPAGKVGIVTARGGEPLPPGRVLAEEGERGIQRHILPPGSYRLNRHGYDVELVNAIDIPHGYVGVLRRLLGKEGTGRYATHSDEKGLLREVLQPGLYYLNTKEFEVIKTEVGIFQTTFHYHRDPTMNTAITFTSKGGFPISVDCTVEWEVLPQDQPILVAEYGNWKQVRDNVIQVQATALGRDKGIDYGVQDLLEGSKREKFQQDFTRELVRACSAKNVTVHSAFIRDIVIPENYLKPIRDKQIAAETEITNQAKELTAESERDVEREQRLIEQRVAEVAAKTAQLVAKIDQDVQNVGIRTQAEIEKLKAGYQAKIAALEADRTRVLGEAETDVTKLKETAKNSLYQMKMDVFQNDANAFLRYTLAEQLNPKIGIRLFHSGPGTFWTNMGDKNMSLMVPTGTPSKTPAKEKKGE
jgi:hypothetical protein